MADDEPDLAPTETDVEALREADTLAPEDTDEGDDFDQYAAIWAQCAYGVARWGARRNLWWAPVARTEQDRHSSYNLGQAYLHRRAIHLWRPGGDLTGRDLVLADIYQTARQIGERLGLRPTWAGVVGMPLLAARTASVDLAHRLHTEHDDPFGAAKVQKLVSLQWHGNLPVAKHPLPASPRHGQRGLICNIT
ncbi:hypothetical protein [Amycolatopsis anabasis]|uniref:hypothetical protein n=1 Tax=Amycolatopsis anabasis TaxID=1840409 RepID=UPI00131EA6FB|nr:hypothetical protein [Amycolatopsis anabasis]